MLEVKGKSRSERALIASNLARIKLNETIQAATNPKETSTVIARMQAITANYRPNALGETKEQKSQVLQTINTLPVIISQQGQPIIKANDVLSQNQSSSSHNNFKHVFYVNSLDNLKGFCRNNLSKLVSLFKKLNENNFKVACHISKPDELIKRSSEDCLSLSDAVKTKDSNDELAAVNVEDELSIGESHWKLSFNISSSEVGDSTRMMLEASVERDDPTSCLLEWKKSSKPSEQHYPKVIEPISDISALLASALDDSDDDYKEILASAEPADERRVRLAREEEEFEAMMSSLSFN